MKLGHDETKLLRFASFYSRTKVKMMQNIPLKTASFYSRVVLLHPTYPLSYATATNVKILVLHRHRELNSETEVIKITIHNKDIHNS